MKQMLKRGLVLLLALVMFVSYIPLISLSSGAADINYVSSSEYIYNWGTRGETATELSLNAEKFYAGSNSYDVLSTYSGGTGTSNAASSQLYKALQTLMKSNHDYQTSYNATKDLFMYTDCQNGGGKISSFYSGTAIGPSWDSGGWNREHTWPDSKGLGGADEDDIMMLRPTATSENSSRGNKAYGESSGYYNPNSESGGKYDLRGDVARIFLYVYVRWGNVNGNGSYSTWGSNGVMENLNVLLKWMEIDPVDTWELGRNDSVESITGTRNVFVDYPEYAFLLFGAEIPDGMTTPSGEANSDCGHNNYDSGVVVVATCTTNGYTLFTCLTAGCGATHKTNTVSAKGHNYSAGVCTVCGEAEEAQPEKATYVTSITPGDAYKLGIYSSQKGAEYYFTGTMSGYYGATDTSHTNAVDVFVETVSGGYRLYFKNSSGTKQYINLVISGTHYNFTYSTTATSTYTWDSSKSSLKTTVSGEACYIGTFDSYVTMGVLRSSQSKDTDYVAHFYNFAGTSGGSGSSGNEGTSGGSGSSGNTDNSCQHDYKATVTAPTCTADGYTTYTCSLCGNSYTGSKTTALGHSYQNGSCTVCGAAKPNDTKSSIGFSDTSSRTVFNTNQQVWVQNGVTITNNKASSSSNVADYSNPGRFYKGSDVIISYTGLISKIEIDCTGLDSKYVTGWMNVSGAIATNNGGIITVELNTPASSFTYANLSAQARAYKITVYTSAPVQESCSHSQTTLTGAVAATCTTDGHTGKTTCNACGEIVDAGSVIKAQGHELGEWTTISDANCTSSGAERRDCDNCSHYEIRDIEALGHVDSNNDRFCDSCGKKITERPGAGGTTAPETGNNGSADNREDLDDNNSSGDSTDGEPSDNNSTVEMTPEAIIVCAILGVFVLAALIIAIKKKKL